MKNKERIEKLESQVKHLMDRVSVLEIWKAHKVTSTPSTPAPAPMPTTWPTYPNWVVTPLKYEPWHVTCDTTKKH